MLWTKNPITKPNALILIAHPDDETIFSGGLLLTYPQWNWTIICATWSLASIRGQQLAQAVKIYHHQYSVNISQLVLLGFPDGRTKNKINKHQLISKLATIHKDFDIVFTHNSKGDYGHPSHGAVHQAALSLYSNIWEFIIPTNQYVAPQPFKTTTHVLPLSKQLLTKKRKIFTSCHRTEQYLWEREPDMLRYAFFTGPELYTQ